MTVEQLRQLLVTIQAAGLDQKLAEKNLNFAIFEPYTALTDSILAAWVAFWAAYLLARANGSRPVMLWGWSFIASAVSSLAGVAFHGSRLVFGMTTTPTEIVWRIVPIATAVSTLCLGWAAAMVWLRPEKRRMAVALLLLELVACLGVVLFGKPKIANDFHLALADSIPVMVVVLIGCFFHWSAPASRWIAAGILTAFIAGGVQATEWHKGNPPDCNDIFHVIYMAAMYLLYRGGALLPSSSRAEAPAHAAVLATA